MVYMLIRLSGLLLLQFLFIFPVIGQDSTRATFYLSIPASYNLQVSATDAERLQALMAASTAARQALSGLTVYSFHQEFPSSHYQYLRSMYALTCANGPASTSAVLSLHIADPAYFPYVKQMPVIANLGTYTPNDYHGPSGADPSAQLDYINATTAWGITKGNRNITIGINDPSGFDIHNPDLVGQVVGIDSGNSPDFHGTIVAGCAAAHTDNGIGVAAIGFNCSLSLNHQGGDGASLSMSAAGIRVLNNSWFYGFDCTANYQPDAFIDDELVYDEVYENGTSTCFAAGNGLSGYGHCPSLFSYGYPASLDHIITVGPVSYQNPLGTMANFNPGEFPVGGIPWVWRDCHEESPGNAIGQYGTLNYQANDRVDISAPAYNVISTYYDGGDTASHYTASACGTSFASPIVAGTLGLMLSANSCLSPYQLEYLLKSNARNIDDVEYPPGSGINVNEDYVGKMGAGALDAGAAVTAASIFDCNDTATQTMYIEGVELNTICAPGFSSNGVKPVLYPVIDHGTPPYTYRWDPIPGNNTTLDDYASASPAVLSGGYALYRLGVYDHSPVPKEASRIIQVILSTERKPMLTIRDSYMDMLNGPNTQADIDGYDWQLWLSPDVVNRVADDHIFVNQNPVYAPSVANYANARIRNVGCAASTGTDLLDLYWTKASTGEAWPSDWTTASYTNAVGGVSPAGGLITASPIVIPAIGPGGEDSISAAWYPPDPAIYDPTLSTVDISLLARIETSATAPYGMDYAEGENTAMNVANNNKIATRSLVVNSPSGADVQWHQVLFANTENYDRQFNLQFASDRELHPSFSGDLSAYTRVEVVLGDLFDRWQAAGSQGTNVLPDGNAKSVIFTADSPIVLKGITIHANEKVTAKVGIIMLQQPVADQYIHIRQWLDTAVSQPAEPYGAVSFLLPAYSDTNCSSIVHSTSANIPLISRVNVYPIPTSGILNILYTGYDENTISYTVSDICGQKVYQQSGLNVIYGSENNIQLSGLSDGIYFVRISDKDNNRTTIKVVKN